MKEEVTLAEVEGLGQVLELEEAGQLVLEAEPLGVHDPFASGPWRPHARDPPVLFPSSLVFLFLSFFLVSLFLFLFLLFLLLLRLLLFLLLLLLLRLLLEEEDF